MLRVKNLISGENGDHRFILSEPLKCDIEYPIEWRRSKVELMELAKLRRTQGLSIPQICKKTKMSRTTVKKYCRLHGR